jgi:sulfite dehydrogenase
MRPFAPGACAAAAVAAAALGVVASAARGADGDANELQLGKTLFTVGAVPPCATCHTLKDAGSTGAIGPVLDDLQPTADRVITALRSGIGMMPSYRGTLSDEQMRAVANYVARASGGAR